MEWKIGNVNIRNQIGLAPMAGTSNPAYMKICEKMNVGFAVTELISSEAIVRNNKKTFDMLKGIEKLNIPVGIQIFGSDPLVMARCAKILCEKYPIKFIDINMGCPVPKVALKSHSGSALLKEPDKVYEIVSAVQKSVDIPVTVKIRSGWDSDSINAVEIAQIIEKAGAKAITIHARTRSQGYSGKADLNIIKKVKESVSIPVVGNGDVTSVYKAKEMLDETKCDAIMIGRGALGNPFLIRDCVDYLDKGTVPKEISKKEKIETIKNHFNYLLEIKGEKLSLLEMRTQAAYYLKGVDGASKIKKQIMSAKTKDEFLKIINDFGEENESKIIS